MEPSEPDQLILSLAEAIADGRPVEWPREHERAAESSGPLIEELRVLAALAELHRTPAGDSPSPEVLGPGDRWGPFAILELLGRGAYGAVYRTRDPRLDRDVALKLIASTMPGPRAPAAVVDEGRVLARLRHPNIVTVYGADVVDGVAGIWMELLRGRTLKEELAARGPFSAREAALVGIELSQALAAVHQAGLVHRDIKAQNVMREAGGRIVLMDFGAGGDLDPEHVSMAGTPLYMAPELLAGGPATAASDLYSLGVLLYHLVTGAFPVQGPTMEELHRAHAEGRRNRLRDVRPDLPAAFVQAVEHATAPDPAARVASAAVLEQALEQVLQGLPAHERAQRAGVRPAWSRRWLVTAGALAVLAGMLAWWSPWSAPPDQGIRSVAVLPFANLTGDASQEYLADGVTEILIGNLAQLPALRVISRTSAMAYKDRRLPLSVVANELDVDAIIEGSVARSGDRLRVVVQLVRANEQYVWGQSYERPAADLFKVQGEIASMVADAIKLSLTPDERRSLAEAPAMRDQAQDAFLRGMQRMNDFRPRSLRGALEDLQEAVRLDPTSARAFATLSQCYLLMGAREIIPRDESYQKALSAATRALQLDDSVAKAHTQLAEVKFYYEWDWETARRGYQRALQLSPNDSHARARYSLFLSALDEPVEAVRQATLAQQLDPFSPVVRFAPGLAFYYARRYDEAIEAFLQLKDIPPYTLSGSDHFGLARAYAERGEFDQALAHIDEAVKLAGTLSAWTAEAARIQAARGQRPVAERMLKRLSAAGGAVTPAHLAFVYAALGDHDRAFAELNRAADQRSPALLWAKVDPRLDALRDDPRFADLVARVGLAK